MIHARIVGSLRDQQRSFYLVGRGKRRTLDEEGLTFRRRRIPHALVERLAASLPVGRYGPKQGDEVGWTEQVHRCRVNVGSESYACQGGVTAIRSTKDANA